MKLLKNIKNNRGAITPFMVIILALFLWLFTISYSYYLSSSQALSDQRILQVASDDLLAGFNETLLKDYGLLAYDSQDALELVESSLSLNRKENSQAKFLKPSTNPSPIEAIDYHILMTLDNRQALADVCVDIAIIQLPKVLIEEAADLYKWRETVEKKARSYKKVDKVMQGMQDLQRNITDYHKAIEEVNDLGGFDASWYDSTDSARASNMLNSVLRDNKKSLKAIKKLEEDLERVKGLYQEAKDINDPELEVLINDLSFDMDDYSAYFSEDESIDDIVEGLEENIDLIEEIIDEEAFDDVGDLNTDFWEKESGSEESSWWDFINGLEAEIDGVTIVNSNMFGSSWEDKSTVQDRVSLSLIDHQLLNEYFLSVLKTQVSVHVRDFPILTRDDRDSVFKEGEVEYLITGSQSSRTKIKLEIFGLRMGSNVIYLLSNQDKFNIAKTAGYAIGGWLPGGGPVGTILVLTAWSGFEGAHDISLLYQGKGVPFVKTDASWYYDIDIDNLSVSTNKNYTDSRKEQLDQYYNDYLRILLILTSADKKVERFQEILLENLKASGADDLDLSQMVTKHKLQWQTHLIEGGYYEENIDE